MKKFSVNVLLVSLIISGSIMGSACAKKNMAPSPSTVSTVEVKDKTKVVATPAVTSQKPEPEEIIQKQDDEKAMAEAKREKAKLAAQKQAAEAARFVDETIHFKFDSAQLSETAKEKLREKAAWMAAHPESQVTVEGHCDERGTPAYNLGLGERRAFAAEAYIKNLGISTGQIDTLSFGEEKPVSREKDEQSHMENRRVQFKIHKKI